MAKITRATQKQFGSSAGVNQMAEFGSFAAATPARYSGATITPAIIQALSNFTGGWFAAVDGENAPTIEDMNALCYLYAYQLGYLLQEGVAEYDAATTYFIGSIVNDGTGILFISLTDNNIGNALTSTTNWKRQNAPTTQVFTGNGTFVTPTGVTRVQVVAEALYGQRVQMTGLTAIELDLNGNTYAWGTNDAGQLGDGTFAAKSSPVLVAGSLSFKQVFMNGGNSGLASTFGIDQFGNTYAWGSNTNGQLGTGNTTTISSPVAVVGSYRFKLIDGYLSTGTGTTYALDLGGNCYAWGANSKGQLGDNTTVPKSSPVLVLGGNTFISLSINRGAPSDGSVYGITAANDLYAWGLNANGQLGDGTVVAKSSPVLVLGSLKWSQIIQSRAGYGGVIGLTTGGDAYAWGAGMTKLTGGVAAVSSPVLIAGGKNFTRIFSGLDNASNPFMIGLQADGTAYSMGANANGLLGDGTNVAKSSPVLIAGSRKFIQVSLMGQNNVSAIDMSNNAYTWGDNIVGQLGDGTVVSKSSPVLVLGSHKWTRVMMDSCTTGQGPVLGIDTDGVMWAWGNNQTGELGDNTSAAKSSPVLVVGSRSPNIIFPQNIFDLDVVPGASYPVICNNGLGMFDAKVLGQVISKITIQY